jgi:hypothetical protein
MSGDGVPDADMPNIPRLPRDSGPELPDWAADALLAGDLLPEEAGGGLQPVAALLAALTAAPADGELAGHARALAEFRRGGMPEPVRHPAHRRARLLTSILSAKAAAAAAAAAAVLGGVATAAYAGALPAPAQQFAHTTIGAPSPHVSSSPGAHEATPTGPDASGPAAYGLCTAWTHAKEHGNAAQRSVAFRNLAAAAGGSSNISAYCAAVPHPGSPAPASSASQAAHPTGKPASHPSGMPTSHPTGMPTTRPSAGSSHPSGAPSHPSGAPSAHPTGKR